MTDVAWTAEEDQALARLIREGASASHIGKQMGRSRSAVCGRAHRKNLHFTSQIQRPAVRHVRPTKQRAPKQFFTADEDKIIVAMSADRKSGTEIAKVLGRSASSVIKRARLLGSNVRAKHGPPKQEPKAPVVKVKKVKLHPANIAGKKESRAHDPEFKHVTPVITVEPLMVAMVDLTERHCRFPVGDPRESGFGFCGHPKEDGAYCRPHAALCYTPPELRRRAAA